MPLFLVLSGGEYIDLLSGVSHLVEVGLGGGNGPRGFQEDR